jgi:hypothetical protein
MSTSSDKPLPPIPTELGRLSDEIVTVLHRFLRSDRNAGGFNERGTSERKG